MAEFNLDAYRAARDTAALFDVSARGKLVAEGTEAVTFLHNLSTNDVKNVAPQAGCELFFCTATAKVIAYARVYRETPEGKRERFWIDVGEGQNEKLFAHLDRYLISEDVTLTDRTTEFAQFHLVGSLAADAVRIVSGWSTPNENGSNRFTVVQLADDLPLIIRESRLIGLPGFDLLCPVAKANDLKRSLLAASATEADRNVYETLRVESGVPEYGSDLDESTFAPEVGRTDAISYQKGCYLGQEPIVMARDRGVVQRTLIGLRVGDEVAPRGSLLYSKDGKEVGRITSNVYSPRVGCWVALGYARRGSQTPGTELEMDVAGTRRAVTVTKLPLEAT